MTISPGAIIPLRPNFLDLSVATNTTLVLDADGEEVAIKYMPSSTSPITHIDMHLDISGTITDTNFRFRVESDAADYPSGSVLGAATAEFAGPAADGFTGAKALVTNTGNLTINVPVWLILYRSSGGGLSGTDKAALQGIATPVAPARGRVYTGGAWDATPSLLRANFVVTHVDGTYAGTPQATTGANPTEATDMFGDYYHGIRFKSGSKIKILGVNAYFVKAGTPNPLVIAVFEGDTLKYSNVVPAASIVTLNPTNYWFTSPILLAANTYLYVICGQEADAADGTLGADGGDDSNDYDSKVAKFAAGYKTAVLPVDMAFVYGDWSTGGSVPSGLTVSTTDFPQLYPIVADMAIDLDETCDATDAEIAAAVWAYENRTLTA